MANNETQTNKGPLKTFAIKAKDKCTVGEFLPTKH